MQHICMTGQKDKLYFEQLVIKRLKKFIFANSFSYIQFLIALFAIAQFAIVLLTITEIK